MSGPFFIFDAAANHHAGVGVGFRWAVLGEGRRALAWCSSRADAEEIRAALENKAEASAHTEKPHD